LDVVFIMKKRLFQYGYYGTVLLLIALNNNFWYTIGKYGNWVDNGVSLLFIFMIISCLITRNAHLSAYYERKSAYGISLLFGVPFVLLFSMWWMSAYDMQSFGIYFTVSLGILAMNYLVAGLLK